MVSARSSLIALAAGGIAALAGCAGTPAKAPSSREAEPASGPVVTVGRIVVLEGGVEQVPYVTRDDPYICVIPYAETTLDAANGAVRAFPDTQGYFEVSLQPGRYGVYVMHRVAQPPVWTGTSPRVQLTVPKSAGGEAVSAGEIRLDITPIAEGPGQVGPWKGESALAAPPRATARGGPPVQAADTDIRLVSALLGRDSEVYIESTPGTCLTKSHAAAIADMPIKPPASTSGAHGTASSPGSKVAMVVVTILLLPVYVLGGVLLRSW
jgi:hypothetical protein